MIALLLFLFLSVSASFVLVSALMLSSEISSKENLVETYANSAQEPFPTIIESALDAASDTTN
ncbi:MAG: hypothetical protein IPM53_01220 [Anaerolineaceae bacterium]|nr:hypothetical protein [Anaerolineaceae bacterium]